MGAWDICVSNTGQAALAPVVAPPLYGDYDKFLVGLDTLSMAKRPMKTVYGEMLTEEGVAVQYADKYYENVLVKLKDTGRAGLKNPLWNIHKTGEWTIYYHFQGWKGSVTATAVTTLTRQYEELANEWLALLRDYDSQAPQHVTIKVFGFVFQAGVEVDETFWEQYCELY